jgi:ribosomal protein S7
MYNDIHIKKFINFLIKKGKKFKALSIFYKVLTLLKEITSMSPIYIIKSLFSSNQKMFFFESKEVKKKKKIKVLFYN